MTEPSGKEKFSPAEQSALDAWEVPPPPADLTAQVLSGVRRQRVRRLGLMAAAAILLLSAAVTFNVVGRKESQGQQSITARTTINIANRATPLPKRGPP